jgi:shikimate dehydrogenase
MSGPWPGGRRCGVLGDPIDHSLSPVLHRAGYAEVGLDWSYDAHRVGSGGLAGFLATLDASWRGLSLTMPLKREAMPLLSRSTDRARLAGAANTLVLEETGVAGDNTDIPGAVAAISERYGGPVRSATILGGGATATSSLLALATMGCRSFVLQVRDAGRVADTLEAAARFPEPLEVHVRGLGGAPTGDLLVSTVPATAQDDELVARATAVGVVFDVVYDPWPTPLAAGAAAAGQVLVGGLDLLVHQAALQFELFTGIPGPLDVMRAAGESALRAREGQHGVG